VKPPEPKVLDRFEQGFLFRVSRTAQLLVSVVVLVLLIIGIVALGLSFLPVSREPAPPEVSSQPVQVSGPDVAAYFRLQSSRSVPEQAPTPRAPDTTVSPSRPDPNAVALATLVDSLRRELAGRGLSWSQSGGPFVINVLTEYNRGGQLIESRAASGDTYLVNPSAFQTKQTILEELLSVVRSSEHGQEMAYMIAWHSLRRERERATSDAMAASQRAREERIMAIEAQYESERQAHLARRKAVILYLPWAIGALVLAGLTLSLLAIERNTRLLRQLLAASEVGKE
jgi:hypothetical protein